MTKKSWLVVFGVGILMLTIAGGALLKINLEKIQADEREIYTDRGLPVLAISLNETSLGEIDSGSKDVRYKDNKLSVYDGGIRLECDGVEIKGRGNATWAWDKKPYQVKFADKIDVLGMKKSRKWYLVANYMDDTNLRNEVGFLLEEMLDMKSRIEGRFVELYMDGEYRGLYFLTQAVEIQKEGVDLRDSLGVLVELDNVYGAYESYYMTGGGDMLTVKDLVNEEKESEAMADFLRNYNELELAVEEKNYDAVKELVDVRSFAQYFLLSEFTVDPDAYWTSFYMYKDGFGDKIHAGPGWDFDMSLANRRWGNWLGERLYSPTEDMVRRLEFSLETWVEMGYDESEFTEDGPWLSKIVFGLMEMDEFKEEVARVFQERLMGRERELLIKIKNEAVRIYGAALADRERWGKEGDLEVETKTLLEWIKMRYEYFEQKYGDEGVRMELR